MRAGAIAMAVGLALPWATGGLAEERTKAPDVPGSAQKPSQKPRSSGMPQTVGTCARTTITEITDRFGGAIAGPGRADAATGTAVSYANGGYQISYSRVAALEHAKIGDAVMVCLISVPTGCPKGDERGRVYTTTNLRSGDVWSMPDSQHLCGGA